MRKTLLLISFLLAGLMGVSQESVGFYAGFLPYNHATLKSKSTSEVITLQYSMAAPSFHAGVSLGGNSLLLEGSYSWGQRYHSSDSVAGITADHWGAHYFFGGSFLPNKRIQPMLYVGMGFSRYQEPISKLYLNIGGKARLLVCLTPRLALYAGCNYIHSVNAKYYVESDLEVEAGIIGYLKPIFRRKSR